MRVTLGIVYCSTLRSQLANDQNITLLPCFHPSYLPKLYHSALAVQSAALQPSQLANAENENMGSSESEEHWISSTTLQPRPVRAVNTANTIPSSEFSQKLHKTFSNVISLVRLLCCSLLHCGARLLNTRPSLEALMSGCSENKIIKKLRSQGKTYFLYITRLRI